MRKSLSRLAEKGGADPDEVLARVTAVDDLVPADLMIEAVVEDVDVKRELFRRADAMLPSEAVLASNTSSIPIASLAAVTGRPDKVIGMHFFNPVPVLRAGRGDPHRADVRRDRTGDRRARRGSGKTPAEARDFPGFVSNRILMPFINEAVYALRDGVAEPEAIDTIAKLGFAHPIGPARARRPHRPRHLRRDHGRAARGARRPEVRAVSAAARARCRGTPRPEVRPRVLRVLGMADPRLEAELAAHEGSDEAFVEAAFRLVLRRAPDDEARERALAKLAAGTLSRATLVHELVTSAEFGRVRELDDAVALGLGARGAGERLRWLQAPAETDERVVEIPWVLSRLRDAGRVLEVGYAFAEIPYLAALLRSGVEVVGVDLATRDVDGMETVEADVRALPFEDGSFDQVLLVSTLEHVGADNAVYGLEGELDPAARLDALRELRRVPRRDGSLLVTVPLGEPGDYGWFRQEDERGWTGLYGQAGLFVEEQEVYELTPEGWRVAQDFHAEGVRYGARGPAASAVLCAELRPGRLRRLATPSGREVVARRRAGRTYRRVRRDL